MILVCDAGGATSVGCLSLVKLLRLIQDTQDLNMLKVRATGHTTELRALDHAEGELDLRRYGAYHG